MDSRGKQRVGAGVAAAAGGAIPALAFPEADLWWLAFVGLAPLLLVVRAAPSGPEAALRAGLGGAAYMLAAHYWLLSYVSGFALVPAALFGLLWAPWGWLAWRLMTDPADLRRLALAVALVPSAWVVTEYLRSWDRLGGPFGLLGATQWNNRPMLGLAALGGVWLVSWVLVAVNVAIAIALLPRVGTRRRISALGAAAMLVAGSLAWVLVRTEPEVVGVASVGMVQTGLGADHAERLDAAVAATRRLAPDEPDLVVWGESSVTSDPATDPELAARLVRLSRQVDAPLLVNVDARGPDGRIAKSAVLVAPEGIDGRYVKQRLVPFGEYVPLRPVLGWVETFTKAADEDRRRGDGVVVLDADGLAVGPLISFELAFPDLARALTEEGAELIVAQSMTSSFQDTWGPEQHASLAAVRAVESGRSVVNVAITGVSAAFDAEGRQLAWFGTDARGARVVEVPVSSGRTPFVRWGDWVPLTSAALLLAAWVMSMRARVRARQSSSYRP